MGKIAWGKSKIVVSFTCTWLLGLLAQFTKDGRDRMLYLLLFTIIFKLVTILSTLDLRYTVKNDLDRVYSMRVLGEFHFMTACS